MEQFTTTLIEGFSKITEPSRSRLSNNLNTVFKRLFSLRKSSSTMDCTIIDKLFYFAFILISLLILFIFCFILISLKLQKKICCNMISEVNLLEDDSAWWIDSSATRHVCKDKSKFSVYEIVEDGSILYMDNSWHRLKEKERWIWNLLPEKSLVSPMYITCLK